MHIWKGIFRAEWANLCLFNFSKDKTNPPNYIPISTEKKRESWKYGHKMSRENLLHDAFYIASL